MKKDKDEINESAARTVATLKEREARGEIPPESILPRSEPLKVSLGESEPRWRDRVARPTGVLGEGPFMRIPIKLDKMAIALGDLNAGLGRALSLVINDLVRHTGNEHGDVVVSNGGIARRRHIGPAAVKAILSLLRDMHVIRVCKPASERRSELNAKLKSGFSEHRRYLKWCPQREWTLPVTEGEWKRCVEVWDRYTRGPGGAERLRVVQ